MSNVPDAVEPAKAKMPGWQLLKGRDFSLLFWGQMTSQIGDSLNRVALLWFVYQLTGSAMKMVMIGLLQTIPPLILSPLIGVYLDRANKKTVMVWVDIRLRSGDPKSSQELKRSGVSFLKKKLLAS